MITVSMKNISLITLLFTCSMHFDSIAQKLPKVQLNGVRAPLGIKIDGKTTEWNNGFKANNPKNRIFYTMSNDDQYVYLTIRAVDRFASEKALYGINLMIKSREVINEKLNKKLSINFPPIIDEEKNREIRFIVTRAQRLNKDASDSESKKLDSLKNMANNFINDSYNEILISGIEAIKEPSISIYNTEGIKIAARFNDQMLYVYELAIPLKHIQPLLDRTSSFAYDIKMDGISREVPGRFPPPMMDIGSMGANNAYISYVTDFSGTYTMVNK